MKYRKKPVVIDAVEWTGELTPEVIDHLTAAGICDDQVRPVLYDGGLPLWNSEERQWITVPRGHWIIRGVRDEVYPCSPEVFAETYEPVRLSAPRKAGGMFRSVRRQR